MSRIAWQAQKRRAEWRWSPELEISSEEKNRDAIVGSDTWKKTPWRSVSALQAAACFWDLELPMRDEHAALNVSRRPEKASPYDFHVLIPSSRTLSQRIGSSPSSQANKQRKNTPLISSTHKWPLGSCKHMVSSGTRSQEGSRAISIIRRPAASAPRGLTLISSCSFGFDNDVLRVPSDSRRGQQGGRTKETGVIGFFRLKTASSVERWRKENSAQLEVEALGKKIKGQSWNPRSWNPTLPQNESFGLHVTIAMWREPTGSLTINVLSGVVCNIKWNSIIASKVSGSQKRVIPWSHFDLGFFSGKERNRSGNDAKSRSSNRGSITSEWRLLLQNGSDRNQRIQVANCQWIVLIAELAPQAARLRISKSGNLNRRLSILKTQLEEV